MTGRDEFIIAEALATALIALEQLPDARQPTRNMADMEMLLNSLCRPVCTENSIRRRRSKQSLRLSGFSISLLRPSVVSSASAALD